MNRTHAAIRATGNADAIAALERHISRVATRRNSPDNDDASYIESLEDAAAEARSESRILTAERSTHAQINR